MKMQTPVRFLIFVLLAVLFSFSASCLAAGNDVKNRMKERLPALTSLKAAGVIGENNAGFLEFRGGEKKQEALIKDENNDRRQVYDAIAKKQGVDSGLVGSRRALQIAEQAPGGTWLQKPDGSWYQK